MRRDRLCTPVFLSFPGGSAGKAFAYNAGDLGSIPGLGRSPGEGNSYPLQYSGLENSMDCRAHGVTKSQTQLSNFHLGFPHSSVGKESACNAEDPGLIPRLGRSLGVGNSNPLQYFCLENPMDGEAWWATVHGVAKSRTRLSDFTFTFTFHFHALEKEMATHSSVLAWRIPGMGEPGGLPSMGSHRVGHD